MQEIELLLDITNILKRSMIKNKLKNNKMYVICFILGKMVKKIIQKVRISSKAYH